MPRSFSAPEAATTRRGGSAPALATLDGRQPLVIARSQPTDWKVAGLTALFDSMLTPERGYYNLPLDAAGDPVAEYLTHFRLGVDGVFSDFADTALEARAKYLKERGL